MMETTQPIVTSGGGETSAQMRWSGRSRGGYFGNWFFIQLIRCFGVWPAYVWLVFVAGYFTLAHAGAYHASADYLEHVFGRLAWWRRPLLVYRHFLAHGISLVDRLAVLMGRSRIECVFDGEEQFKPLVQQHRGIILVGAHIGGWELGGHFLGRFDVPVNLVVIERELAGIQSLVNSAIGERRFRILVDDHNPLRSVPILAALRRGEIVALLGDRSFGGAEAEVSFLGGDVGLPVGPYHLAAASGAPIFQVFVVRERLGRYRFFAFPPESVSREEIRSDRDAVRTRVERYALRLEGFVRQYPFQWANFFPYWKRAPETGSAARLGSNPS
jgi:predicted LPLAT superfamily acyltransferase